MLLVQKSGYQKTQKNWTPPPFLPFPYNLFTPLAPCHVYTLNSCLPFYLLLNVLQPQAHFSCSPQNGSHRNLKSTQRHTDKEHLKGMWNQGVVWTCLITRKVRDKVTGLVRGLRPTSTHVVLPHDSQSRGRARHCACRLLCGQTVGRRCTSLSLQISPPRLEHHTLKITISQ